jgi:hypothetical protein
LTHRHDRKTISKDNEQHLRKQYDCSAFILFYYSYFYFVSFLLFSLFVLLVERREEGDENNKSGAKLIILSFCFAEAIADLARVSQRM